MKPGVEPQRSGMEWWLHKQCSSFSLKRMVTEREAETEREISHLLVHFPSACKRHLSQAELRSKRFHSELPPPTTPVMSSNHLGRCFLWSISNELDGNWISEVTGQCLFGILTSQAKRLLLWHNAGQPSNVLTTTPDICHLRLISYTHL